jgi:putative acyl-CoA dehydrogenase
MSSSTHEVFNQSTPLVGYDAFATDRALHEGVRRHAAPDEASATRAALSELGTAVGSAAVHEWADQADTNPPVLRTHDRFGHRADEVEFHPAWHRLLRGSVAAGLTDPARPLRRTAGFFLATQAEAGHLCPVSMTHAAVAALRAEPEVAAEWVPRLVSHRYDPELRPAAEKPGCLVGMGMTEKQGGSDVRANTTRAEPLAESGWYALTGHKWFCSAPMSDAFLVLAQAPDGLSCFLLPRVLPDGTRNSFALQRLKSKLGNRSNASAEVEFSGSWARRIGPEGGGLRAIMPMVAATRLDCATGSAALMRQAVARAVHHAEHRSAFGGPLLDKPLMRNVLADLAVESEAATALVLRLAAAAESSGADGQERALLRLGTAVAKYWVSKRCSPLVAEALECLGGNGYVEESGMPRLFRESPLNSIWEGSGNVNALDVVRVLRREPQTLDALLRELGTSRGADHRLDAAVKELLVSLGELEHADMRARHLVERIALVLQGSLLVRHAPPAVADAFCASRLGGEGGLSFGTLPAAADAGAIVERARPTVD